VERSDLRSAVQLAGLPSRCRRTATAALGRRSRGQREDAHARSAPNSGQDRRTPPGALHRLTQS